MWPERERGVSNRAAGAPGQCQAEGGALAGFTPGLQPPLVEPSVLQGDRQSQTGASGGPGARGVGSPEPVEDEGGLPRAQTHTVVSDRHRNG
jgi:hypothetical protein